MAYEGRYGLVVLPVYYRMYEGDVVFRTAHGSPMDEDLRTGIPDADYKVAFEIDHVDVDAYEGWSVLIQGSAHHVSSEAERAVLANVDLEVWPSGLEEHFVRIAPMHITGRNITHTSDG